MSLMKKSGGLNKKIWNEVESQLFEKMATEPIKREGRSVYGKLKKWIEHIKTNFNGQDVPYDMKWNGCVKDWFCIETR